MTSLKLVVIFASLGSVVVLAHPGPSAGGSCSQVASCIRKQMNKVKTISAIDRKLTPNCARAAEYRDLMNKLRNQKYDRLQRLIECIQGKNDGAYGYFLGAPCPLPLQNAKCTANAAAKAAAAEPVEDLPLIEDEESVGMLGKDTMQCIGPDMCACPELDYCLQCYHRELLNANKIDTHNLHHQLLSVRMECGLGVRFVPK